jgi:hypothetical protein
LHFGFSGKSTTWLHIFSYSLNNLFSHPKAIGFWRCKTIFDNRSHFFLLLWDPFGNQFILAFGRWLGVFEQAAKGCVCAMDADRWHVGANNG